MSVEIKLTRGWIIRSDSFQWMLNKVRTTGKTAGAETTVGFYSNFGSLSRGITETLLRESEAKSLPELLATAEEIKLIIEEASEALHANAPGTGRAR